MVDKKPETESDLGSIDGLSQKQLRALGRGLLGKINEALALSEENLPAYPRKERQSIPPKVAKRVKALKQWREQRAGSLDIDPALICTNAQIESLALAHPKKVRDLEGIGEMRKWQTKIFGREICALLKTVD